MKKIPLAQPDINDDDINAVKSVLQSGYLSRGPVVEEFEQQFCQLSGCDYACAVSSGSAGLIIALQALGVKAGDEVITVSFTVPATVNSIVAIGAIPVMVDIEMASLGMDINALQAAIGPQTRAIIVVHAFGKAAPIKHIMKIAAKNGIKVIEDACEAIGNNYDGVMLGRYADAGVYGFYPNKQVTAGEGGMIITDDQQVHDSCILLRNHGRSMNGELYDQITFGWNARLSDINAALALSQLRRLPTIIHKRVVLANYYQQNLNTDQASIVCPEFNENETGSAWFVYVVRLLHHDRDHVYEAMRNEGIQCGRYFAPVHKQPYYLGLQPQLSLKNTELIASQCLTLPFYVHLSESDIVYICDKLLKITELY